jgi:hypothetical protein
MTTLKESFDENPTTRVLTRLESGVPIATIVAEEEARRAKPFDSRTEVSADAKYIVRNLVIWFLVVPIIVGVILWAAMR